MKNIEINSKDPKSKTILLILFCISGVVLFVYVGIIPSEKTLASLNSRIKKVQYDIDVQEALLPIYRLLKKELDRENNDSSKLHMPDLKGLSKYETDKIFTEFRTIAEKVGLKAVSIVPDLNSVVENSKYLLVSTVYTGVFFNFREMLISLMQIPYVDHIGSLEIGQSLMTKEYKLDVWVTLD